MDKILQERNDTLEAQLSLLGVSDGSRHHPQITSSPVPQPRTRTRPTTKDARAIPRPRSKLPQSPNAAAEEAIQRRSPI